LVPPPAESEAEMAWAQQDRPIPYGAV
jgi:hypothetical protein